MLRHACGFKLANDNVETRAIQSYLGHANITHTVRYTELGPNRFKGFWNELQAERGETEVTPEKFVLVASAALNQLSESAYSTPLICCRSTWLDRGLRRSSYRHSMRAELTSLS